LNGHYRALTVGINQYDLLPTLKNPINDAEAVARELKTQFGFEVRVLQNPDKREFMTELAKLQSETFGPDDELFIFIASHGVYDPVDKTGYLAMKDSYKDDPTHYTYVSEEEVFRRLAGITARHVLVVIDACQSGAQFLQRGDPKSDMTYQPDEKLKTILKKKDKRALYYITSGGNEYVPDGEGPHSPFTNQLLRALAINDAEGLVTLTDIWQMVDRVERAPQPQYDRLPDGDPAADFWLVSKPELRGETKPGLENR
jgi:uncharacterized caspase-like protein